MNLSLALYQKLYLIRQATQVIRREYPNDQIKTPVHLSMGEEAIAVGVCHAIGQQGQFFGTYRNHGLYLSLTLETDKFFAELYGKKTGVCGGKAGSMHLTASGAGLMSTSAVVGTTIPVAVGAAFANKVKRNGKISVVFFGDGALDEGAFWESFNMACVMRLPVIFICEDNGLAPHIKKAERQGYNSIKDILSQFDCSLTWSNTTDVEDIYQWAIEAATSAKSNQSPIFMCFEYFRYLEHVGVNEDFDQGYRTREEGGLWYKKDPINLQRSRLLLDGLEQDVLEIEHKINNQIEKSVALAKAADFPAEEELFKGVLA